MSTTIKTGWLKDNNGEKFAPRTITSQITTNDGTSLEQKIETDILNSINEAKEYTNCSYTNSILYTDGKIADLINGAPTTLDTLNEIAEAMEENKEVVEALDEAIGTKASQAELDSHMNNSTIHITTTERTNWNDANTKKHEHNNKSVLDGITSTKFSTWDTVSNKVDKVSGKGLSTNDYTNEEKAQVETNKTDILLLKDEVEDLQNAIVKSTDYTYPHTKPGGLRLLEMVGATVQNGEPSQSNPIAIENVGDCVEMEQGYYILSNGTKYNDANCVRTIRKIPCKKGDTITISTERAMKYRVLYSSNGSHIGYEQFDENVNEHTIIVEGNATEFVFFVYNESEQITPQTVGKISLTVNGKHVVQIVESGDDLVKSNEFTPYSGGSVSVKDNTITVVGTWYAYVKIDVKPNTLYIVEGSCTSYTQSNDYGIYDESRENRIITDNGVFNSGNNKCVHLLLYSSKSAISGTSVFKDMAIRELKVTTIFLDEPLREGDRLVKVDGVINHSHKRKNIVLDGSNLKTVSFTYENVVFYALDKPTDMDSYGKIAKTDVLSDKFTNSTVYPWDDSNNVGKVSTSAMTHQIWFGFPVGTTLEQAQVIGDIELEYDLTEETLTPLDTQSQIALNGLETFKDMTYLEVDSKIKPSGIEVEYGTSQVGAYTLKCMNENDTDKVLRSVSSTTITTNKIDALFA